MSCITRSFKLKTIHVIERAPSLWTGIRPGAGAQCFTNTISSCYIYVSTVEELISFDGTSRERVCWYHVPIAYALFLIFYGSIT